MGLIRQRTPGFVFAVALAMLAMALAGLPISQQAGLSPLPVAILLGIAIGNSLLTQAPGLAAQLGPGIDWSRTRVLRIAIVFYGFRVSFQDVATVGLAGILIGVIVVAGIYTLAVTLGPRLFGVDRETSALIGAGSAICGAAAVLAAEPIVRAPAHKVSVAVATVVVFGTIGMFLYPLLYSLTGMSEAAYGLYAGSTIHEVAQVVVAGRAISEEAAGIAVIEKMFRVMLLAPFLVMLAWQYRNAGEAGTAPDAEAATASQPGDSEAVQQPPPWLKAMPWFAFAFLGVVAVNSLRVVPADLVQAINVADSVALAVAMGALGIRTRFSAIRAAGVRPLGLAATLFLILVGAGYLLNIGIGAAIG